MDYFSQGVEQPRPQQSMLNLESDISLQTHRMRYREGLQ